MNKEIIAIELVKTWLGHDKQIWSLSEIVDQYKNVLEDLNYIEDFKNEIEQLKKQINDLKLMNLNFIKKYKTFEGVENE